jgi:hypothetical protein
MTIAKRLMDLFSPNRGRRPDIDASISAALAEGEKTREAVREITATSRAERADANDLAGTVQKRLAKIEERRERRQADPRISVIVEAIRILEGR